MDSLRCAAEGGICGFFHARIGKYKRERNLLTVSLPLCWGGVTIGEAPKTMRAGNAKLPTLSIHNIKTIMYEEIFVFLRSSIALDLSADSPFR